MPARSKDHDNKLRRWRGRVTRRAGACVADTQERSFPWAGPAGPAFQSPITRRREPTTGT